MSTRSILPSGWPEDHGIVLLNGGGFEAPDWSLRVSLANLPDDVYDEIGRGLRPSRGPLRRRMEGRQLRARREQTFYNEFFEIFGATRRKVASFEEPVKRLRNTLIPLSERGHPVPELSKVWTKKLRVDILPCIRQASPRIATFQRATVRLKLQELPDAVTRACALAHFPPTTLSLSRDFSTLVS